jgi:hypothetical protein
MTIASVSRRLAVALALMVAPLSASWADGLPAATGEVILTIDGMVAENAPAGGYTLDLEGLKSLQKQEFQTTTIWTDGSLTFTGVPLKTLLTEAGATGTIVVAEALNGYAVEIPVADLDDKAPIVAYFINGESFSRRDKGPLWVVFPYDSDEKYKSEVNYAYSIWQLQRLTVK